MAISIGDAVLKLGIDTKDLDKGMQGIGNTIKKHQKAIGLGMVAAGGAILAAGVLSIKTFAEMGDEVQKMAIKTGLSTEALSELRHAAEISGTSIQGIEKGIKRMASTLLDAEMGLATSVDALNELNLSVEDFKGLSPEEAFIKFMEAIADVEDPLKRSALAQDIFGKSGVDLLPIMASGSKGLADLRQEAHDLGIVFDQEAANKAAEFTDAMLRVNEATSGVKMAIAEQLIPILLPLIVKVKDIISSFSTWAKENPGLTRTLVIVTTAAGGLLIPLGMIMIMLPSITKGFYLLRTATLASSVAFLKWAAVIAAALVPALYLGHNIENIQRILARMDTVTFPEYLASIKRRVMGLTESLIPSIDATTDLEGAIRDAGLAIEDDFVPEIVEGITQLTEFDAVMKGIVGGWEQFLKDTKASAKAFREFGLTTEDIVNYLATKWDMTSQQVVWQLQLMGIGANEVQYSLDELGITARDVAGFVKKLGDELSDTGKKAEEASKKATDALDALQRGLPPHAAVPPILGTIENMILPGMAGALTSRAGHTVERVLSDIFGTPMGERGQGWAMGGGFGEILEPFLHPKALDDLIKWMNSFALGYMGSFQQGGIATRPMLASVAEKGPEAVIPLDRGTLERLGLGGYKTANIYFQLDGRTLARIMGQELVDDIRLRTGARM